MIHLVHAYIRCYLRNFTYYSCQWTSSWCYRWWWIIEKYSMAWRCQRNLQSVCNLFVEKIHWDLLLFFFLLFSKSFILTTLAFTWVAFALGALSWWAPKCLQYAQFLRNNMSLNETTTSDGNSVKAQYERESLSFVKLMFFLTKSESDLWYYYMYCWFIRSYSWQWSCSTVWYRK